MDLSVSCQVPAWIHQWAAELLKKQITSYAKTIDFMLWLMELSFSSAPHPCLDPRHLENSTRMSTPHTHMFTSPCWLLWRQHTHTARPRSTHRATHTSIYTHTWPKLLCFYRLKSHPLISVAYIKIPTQEVFAGCKKQRYKCTAPAYMHHDSEKVK